jgi:hypothetical protein
MVDRLKKTKFTGFNLEDSQHTTILNCEEADIMLLMPVVGSDVFVRDIEEREVVAVEETAVVVEMQAA